MKHAFGRIEICCANVAKALDATDHELAQRLADISNELTVGACSAVSVARITEVPRVVWHWKSRKASARYHLGVESLVELGRCLVIESMQPFSLMR